MRPSLRKYSWTPACDSHLENTPGHPRVTVNLKMLLDNRVRQWIKKYSWTPACDSQLENTSGHPCDSHFPKGVSAFSQSFPLKHWNKTNVIERIPHYASCQQCKPCQQCQQFRAWCYLHLWWCYFLPMSSMRWQSEFRWFCQRCLSAFASSCNRSRHCLWIMPRREIW